MSKGKSPAQYQRKGPSLMEFFDCFPDDMAAEAYLVEVRWPDGPRCPRCDAANVQIVKNRKSQPYRCGTCRKHFSVRTNTPMHVSNLGFRVWLLAMYLMVTGIKGTSSMKMRRDSGVTYRTAWHLSHRIRQVWTDRQSLSFFNGPVETDETLIGGKAKNMHAGDRDRRISGRGGVDKTAVVGVKDRVTSKVNTEVVKAVDASTSRTFVDSRAAPATTVFTDGATAYRGRVNHHTVLHSAGEYVRGEASTNGIESLWSMPKRGYVGRYHNMSDKHLHGYVSEFTSRHDIREADTVDQMAIVARQAGGHRLRCGDPIADDDLTSGARS